MPLKDMTYQEGSLLLLNRLRRVSVLRDALLEEELAAMNRLLQALYTDNPFDAAEEYHVLSHALITKGKRRVSGDLFRDYLLYLFLERENAFSRAAAQGCYDEPLAAAMRQDLIFLEPFFALGSVLLKRWLGDCYRDVRNRPRNGQKDNIAVLSSAVWSGGSSRPLPIHAPNVQSAQGAGRYPPSLEENDFISWRYQPEEFAGAYVADSALEELYHRLLHVEDKGLLLDDLWNFHASYGTGCFLRARLFGFDYAGRLFALAEPHADYPFTFYPAQQEQLLKNTIRFMQDEQADNIAITGESGTGKTAQVFSLAHELPELRLFLCPRGALHALLEALPSILAQPRKAIVLLDDFDIADPLFARVKAAVAPTGEQNKKVLLIATAKTMQEAFFPLRIHLPAPQLKEWIELVQLKLLQQGVDMDFDSIQNACIDYAAAAGAGAQPLSYRSAQAIVEKLVAQ